MNYNAEIFSKTYGIEPSVGGNFNVFGRRQDPNGAVCSWLFHYL